MKTILAVLLVFATSICNPHAESFSTSTNFIRTLTIGTSEAIFITTLKQSVQNLSGTPRQPSVLFATVSRSNQSMVVPILIPDVFASGSLRLPAFGGPMDIQFQQANVIIEFQRIQTTNVFTAFFNASNGIAIDVPAGKTINFLSVVSWPTSSSFCPLSTALMTLSNNITTLNDTLYGNENFTGPLAITLKPGMAPPSLLTYTDGWVTYYFTEEFAALPNIGATMVPAGKNVIAIEKSLDLVHWGTAFFTIVGSDQSGFYRFNVSK